jgi:hypothetical protein
MQPPKTEFPLNTWRLSHLNLKGTKLWLSVDKLGASRHAVGNASGIIMSWVAHYRDGTPMPNLVECVASYGYARLVVHDWEEFPIEVPPSQAPAWEEWNMGVTFHDYWDRNIAGVAGGFLQGAARYPDTTTSTIQAQLQEKYARLDELTSKPLEWFAARTFTEEEIDDGADWKDIERVREVFKIYEQLTCFLYAMPKFSTFAITEESAEFGLPSKQLYEAFRQIDMNQVYAQLADHKDKLRAILRFLAKQKNLVNVETAPETFWWRHWNTGAGSRKK